MLTLPPRNPRFAFTVFLKLLPQLAILPRVDKTPPGQGHAISSTDVSGGTMLLQKLGYPSRTVHYLSTRIVGLGRTPGNDTARLPVMASEMTCAHWTVAGSDMAGT